MHVAILQRIVIRMSNSRYTNEDEQLLREFIELCEKRKDLGEYYTKLI